MAIVYGHMQFDVESVMAAHTHTHTQVQHFPEVRPFSLPLLVFHKNPQLLSSTV